MADRRLRPGTLTRRASEGHPSLARRVNVPGRKRRVAGPEPKPASQNAGAEPLGARVLAAGDRTRRLVTVRVHTPRRVGRVGAVVRSVVAARGVQLAHQLTEAGLVFAVEVVVRAN